MGPGFEPLRAYKERDWDNIKIPFILGGMVEWSITTVLKTVVLRGTGGSNPSPSATQESRKWLLFALWGRWMRTLRFVIAERLQGKNPSPSAMQESRKWLLLAFMEDSIPQLAFLCTGWIIPQKNEKHLLGIPHFYGCGERGIRTPGASQHDGFQDRCNRPLYHLSLLKGSKSSCKVNVFFVF